MDFSDMGTFDVWVYVGTAQRKRRLRERMELEFSWRG